MTNRRLHGAYWADFPQTTFGRYARFPLGVLAVSADRLRVEGLLLPAWTAHEIERSELGVVQPVRRPNLGTWRAWGAVLCDGRIPTVLFLRRFGVRSVLESFGWPVAEEVLSFGEFRERADVFACG